MVAKSDCAEKSKSGNKVSKPLMEKKRRARINHCLDQLKSLLESCYSTSIRKRKLEKADILELTVKHLKNLQKIQSCTAAASDFSDYQTGFRNCLANVNQYLLMAENLNGSEHWRLSQLSHKLSRSRSRSSASSTMDSNLETQQTEPQHLLHPEARPEEAHTATTAPLMRREDSHPSSEEKQADFYTPQTQKTEKSHNNNKFVTDRNEVANAQLSVWRPW